jgi:GT2 family glycosyltransferase
VVATHGVERMDLLEHCVQSSDDGTVLPSETIVVVDSNPSIQAALREELLLSMRIVAPTKVVEVELGRPLAPIAPATDASARYPVAFVLVRLHGEPLGTVSLKLHDGEVDVETLTAQIRRDLGHRIADHLARDGATGDVRFKHDGSVDAPSRCAAQSAVDAWPLSSVIVCTRDRPRELEVCLQTLLRMTHPRFEVIVVDSAPSTAATREAVARYAGGPVTVRYVREAEPGLARARNRGVAAAAGEVVAFTDDDVRVDAGWLSELTRAFGVTSGVGCTTGLSLPAELETPSQVWFEEFGGFSKGFERCIFDLDSHRAVDPLYPYKVGWFGSGLNMAFDATLLRALGGFDEHLGAGTRVHGGEDLDAFLRVILQGSRLVYEPRALVWHYHRREPRALRRQLHGSGSGLAAVLVKRLRDRSTRRDVLASAWPGLRYLLAPSSPKNRRKTPGFPRSLTVAELAGVAAGPFIYSYSVLRRST